MSKISGVSPITSEIWRPRKYDIGVYELVLFVILLFNFVPLFIASFKSKREIKNLFLKKYYFNYSLFASL